MEPINVNLSCDLQHPVKVQYLDGYFFSKDSAGHKINVDVFNNGVPVSVGGSVSADVIRSDGETVPATGAVSENRAYVILPQAAYAVVGAAQITIKVTEGTTIVTIACFVVYVHESDTGIIVDPGTIIPSIQALISQIETAVESIPADYSSLWTSLAPAFSTSTAYAVGQYVTNSGVLYRFTTAHPAGTWNSAHVTAVNLGAEVYNLKSALNVINIEAFGGVGEGFPLEFENGTYEFTATGKQLVKYYSGGYNLTRKVVKSTTFTPPCAVNIKAKDGYSFTVFLSSDGLITGSTGLITEYTMYPGQQYGMTLRTTGGSDNISSVPVSSIIDIEYESRIDSNEETTNIVAPKNKFTGVLYSGSVNAETGGSTISDVLFRTGLINVEGIENIVYKRIYATSSSSIYGMAFYSSDLYSSFISGQKASLGAAVFHWEYEKISVPSTAKYARFTWSKSLGEFAVYDASQYDKTLVVRVANLEDEAETANDNIENIREVITETEVVDIASAFVRRGLITIANLWSLTLGFDSYSFAIGKGEYYELSVTASADKIASVGLLKNSNLVNGETPPFCDGITGRIVVQAGETANIKIPSDCAYIVIMKTGTNSVDYTPASIVFKKWGMSSLQVIPLGLHEMPSSESALNIVKRCRQMSDIKWTPAVDLPRYMLVQRKGEIPESASSQNYLGTFKAGVEYTGIPYGRVIQTMDDYGYNYGTVGRYIDFKTFVTSIMNPLSRLSKENVGSVSGHRSVIYATVCSGMTCYALNVPEVQTANIGNISGLVLVGKLNNNGVLLSDSSIKIGDVLNLPSNHTAIITDIMRDTDGVIQAVELTDASTAGLADRNYDDGLIGGLCRRKGWTREQFFAEGSWGDYYVYRYTKNVPYTPSPYVNVGDEFNFQRIEHLPVMPYEGEGFVFKTGYIPNNAVKLVIHLGGYGFLRVFKDGNEISGSPFAVESGTEEISISTIDAGNYTAYLCNMDNGQVTNLTAECSWAITE